MAKTTKPQRKSNHAKKVKAARAKRIQKKRGDRVWARGKWNAYKKTNILPVLRERIQVAVLKLDELGGVLPREVLAPREEGKSYELKHPTKELLDILRERITETIHERVDKALDAIKTEFGTKPPVHERDEKGMVLLEAELARLRAAAGGILQQDPPSAPVQPVPVVPALPPTTLGQAVIEAVVAKVEAVNTDLPKTE